MSSRALKVEGERLLVVKSASFSEVGVVIV